MYKKKNSKKDKGNLRESISQPANGKKEAEKADKQRTA